MRVPAPSRGFLIVFEGIDRSGKSSQAKMLRERLERDGIKVRLICFPDRSTPVGSLLDRFLSGGVPVSAHVSHLLFAANRWELEPEIRSLIQGGVVVILDRYSFSGVAYSTTAALSLSCATASAAGAPPPRPLAAAFARGTEEGLPLPDRVFFLDISPEETARRKEFGAEVYEELSLQRGVYAAFSQFQSFAFWLRLPVSGLSPAEVHRMVLKEVADLFTDSKAPMEKPHSKVGGEKQREDTLWPDETTTK